MIFRVLSGVKARNRRVQRRTRGHSNAIKRQKEAEKSENF